MAWYLNGPRSNDGYDDYTPDGGGSSRGWKDLLQIPLFILFLPLFFLILIVIEILPLLTMLMYFLNDQYTTLRHTADSGELSYPTLFSLGMVGTPILAVILYTRPASIVSHYGWGLILSAAWIFLFTVLPFLMVGVHWIVVARFRSGSKGGDTRAYLLYIFFLILLFAAILHFFNFSAPSSPNPSAPFSSRTAENAQNPSGIPSLQPTAPPSRTVEILVDDFRPQPYPGDAMYFYNRLDGDRGALNNSLLSWGDGWVKTAIAAGNSWGGLWMSLDHPIREGLGVNFSSILPSAILPAFQAGITGITVHLRDGSPGRTFRVELKDDAGLRWKQEITLAGGPQSLSADLPPLQNISQLVFVLDHANPGEYVVMDAVSLTAVTPILDTATAAFVWSYGMLLDNWNPATGLVRDKAKDASGEFDAIQATGALAAATAVAEQVGILRHADAVSIVSKISDTLLRQLPRFHGLWPHWVKTGPDGGIDMVAGTEWSSVDSVLAAVGLLEAQNALGLDPSQTREMLDGIEWDALIGDNGIAHGFSYDGELIPYAWDTFGGESWLVELAYAGATGRTAPLAHPSPPTANGSGFIDELAWLFLPPPSQEDYWGTDWTAYRTGAAEKQSSYYPSIDSSSCFAQLGWFGLSAAEVPASAQVPKDAIYQAFGLGGQFASANDGSALLGTPVVVPHYAALAASLQPEQSIRMWDQFIDAGWFSPLTNVESLDFPAGADCASQEAEWNSLKGSWNLSLQTLGWGRFLAERKGETPVLWQAALVDPFLRGGYKILSPNDSYLTVSVPAVDGALHSILDSAAPSCELNPAGQWRLPGIYTYSSLGSDGSDFSCSITQPFNPQMPARGTCSDFQWVNSQGIPVNNDVPEGHWQINPRFYDRSTPYGYWGGADRGIERCGTKWGAVDVYRIDTTFRYDIITSNLSHPSGTITTAEWTLCGAGLVHLEQYHNGNYQGRDFQEFDRMDLESIVFYL